MRVRARVMSACMSDEWVRTWPAYVRRQVKRADKDAVATQAGVHIGTVNRWLSSDPPRPSVENVVSLGRARREIGKALVAAGYLHKTDLGKDGKLTDSGNRLEELSDDEFVQELADRLASRRIAAAEDTQVWASTTGKWRRQDPGVSGMEYRNSRG